MNHWVKIATAALLATVACSPGADQNGFPTAEAQAICHFQYHCCTPPERDAFPVGNTFTNDANNYRYSNESECVQKLSDVWQNQAQPIQASVRDGRIKWDATGAQACLSALSTAAGSCDAQGYTIALNGDPSKPTTKPVCDDSQWITGQVAANGACTIALDCSQTGAPCTPDAGMPLADGGAPPPVVSTGGFCTPRPTKGQACDPFNNPCQTGDSCCNGNGAMSTCAGYVAEGGTCGMNAGTACQANPCDPTKDFCGANGTMLTCQALIASGSACGKDLNGNTLNESCQSHICNAGSCAGANQMVTYDICKGNPDGI